MSTDPLVTAFFEEATELLADFEAGLLRLETEPEDGEVLHRVFRSAHTLKGNSAMLGFEDIARFTHVLEDLLDQLRRGQRAVVPLVVDALLGSGDVLRALVARARDGRPPTPEESAETEEALDALAAVLRSGEPAPTGRALYEIRFRPPRDLFRRGLDPGVILDDLARLGEVVRVTAIETALPSLGAMDPECCYLGWDVWLLSSRQRPEIEACFEFVADPAAVTMDVLTMDAPGSPPTAAERSPSDLAAPVAPRRPTPAAVAETSSIRVPVEKVDRLLNLVGELVITQSMVAQTVNAFTLDKLGALVDAVGQMDRHARELHERMMAVRMIPIRSLFSRFPRVVRDLAGAVGKQVVLDTTGEDTELDKTVIERVGDPLTHLVRNAVDHGIEPPEERRAAGKPAAGRLALRAWQQGGNIYIEVADDGRGIDRERVRARAVNAGIVGPDDPLTDAEIFGLIFRPGLSTAEQVTEVSGRGVGMDVVRQNVEALGGSITTESTPGRGTAFRIKLPLTLAILDGQVLCVGDQTYVLPLVSIVESVRPQPGQLNRVLGSAETIWIRGQVLPVVRLHRLFGVRPRAEDPTEGLVVIVEQDGRKAALLVDELGGQQQVVIKSLETNFDKVRGVAGATILGDGRVTLILDVPGLLAIARAPGREAPVAA